MATFKGKVENIENNLNKVSAVDENSTDEQYPSAACLYKRTTAYPVESGTKDGWIYRVWGDGTAECWTRMSSTLVTPGNDTMVMGDPMLPFEFADNPIITCSGHHPGDESSYVTSVKEEYGAAVAYMQCTQEISDDYPCWFNFYVIGKIRKDNINV